MLTGRIKARSQKDAIEQAAQRAEAWYGTACVSVTLIDPQDESLTLETLGEVVGSKVMFSADYEAKESHRWDRPPIGFPRCIRCGLEGR